MIKMKNWLRNIMLMAVAMTAFHAAADDGFYLNDTVYFYETWEQMYSDSPVFAVTPWIYSVTPYELYFETGNERFDETIEEKFIAATLGDSVWLVNSNYVKKYFKGDAKKLNGFVPLFFSDRVAFAVYAGINDKLGLKEVLFGDTDQDYSNAGNYYYFDFLNHKVLKVNPSVLSDLLEDYHDLQMRYEGMKDYKKRHIIEDYFYKYVDRANDDFMRPLILDLVRGEGM